MKKLNLVNKFLMLFIMICLLAFTGCKKENENKDDDNKQDVIPETPTVEIINEHTTFNILEGTIYETTVHKFKSNIEGPKVAIVGGIHGDEVAGWKAALELVKRDNFKGEVLIIPQAHILADTLEHRYPGYRYDVINTKEHNGIKYEEGLYESLVIEIGNGEGSNYWCFLYPSLCMIDFKKNNSNFKYKSKISEIIDNLF